MRQEVTLISKDSYYYGGGMLAILVGQGPKNLKVCPVHDGEEWEPRQVLKDHYIIVPGHHRELIDRVLQAKREHQEAEEKRNRDREAAIYQFRRKWDSEHPYPKSPDIQALVGNTLF